MLRGEELQTVATAATSFVNQTIGLGLVLKVDLVKELIDAAIAKVRPAPTQ